MGSADREVGEPRERIEGVRVSCWDAKRRVWKAIELLERERGTVPRRSAQESLAKKPGREASTGR